MRNASKTEDGNPSLVKRITRRDTNAEGKRRFIFYGPTRETASEGCKSRATGKRSLAGAQIAYGINHPITATIRAKTEIAIGR